MIADPRMAPLPRILVVSSCSGPELPPFYGLEIGGLPHKLALRELLEPLRQAHVDGGAASLEIDTLHLPYQHHDYGAELIQEMSVPYRYDVVISHIVMDSGARVTLGFYQALREQVLAEHGQLWNQVTCIRKTTLHQTSDGAPPSSTALPCVFKLNRNFNSERTVALCRSEADVAAWYRATPEDQQAAYVREPFYEDYTTAGSGRYRLERWTFSFGDLIVEARWSDHFFIKASNSLRYQLRDRRVLESDVRLLTANGWSWPGQSLDCAYDEDAAAWDARLRVVHRISEAFALQFGELDVIRTAAHEFRVIDVTNTGGVPMASRHCVRLAQARLVEQARAVALAGLKRRP